MRLKHNTVAAVTLASLASLMALSSHTANAQRAALEKPASQSSDSLDEKIQQAALEDCDVVIIGEHAGVRNPQRNSQYKYTFNVGINWLFPRLDVSEPQLDMVRKLGFDVRSFKDWEKEGILCDGWIQVGKYLSDKVTILASAGGAAADIKNDFNGKLLSLHVPNGRTEFFITPIELRYAPFGRASLDREETSRELKRIVDDAVRNAKPWVGFTVGLNYVNARGSAYLEGPFGNKLYLQKMDDDHIFGNVSVRAGLDFPLNRRDYLTLFATYYRAFGIDGLSKPGFDYQE